MACLLVIAMKREDGGCGGKNQVVPLRLTFRDNMMFRPPRGIQHEHGSRVAQAPRLQSLRGRRAESSRSTDEGAFDRLSLHDRRHAPDGGSGRPWRGGGAGEGGGA